MGARVVITLPLPIINSLILISTIYQICAAVLLGYHIAHKKYLLDPSHKYSFIAILIGNILVILNFWLLENNFIENTLFFHILTVIAFIWFFAALYGIRLEKLLKRIILLSIFFLFFSAFGNMILAIEIPITLYIAEIVILTLFILTGATLSFFSGFIAKRYALVGNSIFQFLIFISIVLLILAEKVFFIITYAVAATFLIGSFVFLNNPNFDFIKVGTTIGFIVQLAITPFLIMEYDVSYTWTKALGSIIVLPLTLYLLTKVLDMKLKTQEEKFWNKLSWIFLGFLLFGFANNVLVLFTLENVLSITIFNAFEWLSFIIISSNVLLFVLYRLLRQFPDKYTTFINTISRAFGIVWKALGVVLVVILPLDLMDILLLEQIVKSYILITILLALAILLFFAFSKNVIVYAYYAFATFFLLGLFLLFYIDIGDNYILIFETVMSMILIHVMSYLAIRRDIK